MTPPRPADADALFAAFRRERTPHAFAAFFDAVAGELFETALRLAHDAAGAEDAVQETFVALLDLAERHDPARPVRPWLLGILRNKLREARRGAARHAARARHARGADAPPDPADEVAGAEDRARVGAALDELAEPYRAVAVLRWRYGLEPAEIADAVRRPPGTVRAQLARARERLRLALGLAAVLPPGSTCPEALHALRRRLVTRVAADAASALAGASTVAFPAWYLGAFAMKRVVVAVLALLVLLVAAVLATRPPRDTAAVAHPPAPDATADGAVRRRAASSHPDAVAPPPTDPAAPLRDPRAVRGSVVDETGAPVAGADVLVAPDESGGGLRTSAEVACAVTAEDGTFELTPPDVAPTFRLVASSAGHAPSTLRGVRPGTGDALLVLRAGTTLCGRVVGEDGLGIEGARVRFVQAWPGAAFVRESVCGAGGAYEVAGLPALAAASGSSSLPRAYVLAVADGYAFATHELPPRADLATPLDLRLCRGQSVEGVVLDADTHEPVVGARVVAWTYEHLATDDAAAGSLRRIVGGSGVLAETTSDAAGRFRIEAVPVPGSTGSAAPRSGGARGQLVGGLAALAPGYVAGTDEIPALSDGATSDATLLLWRPARIIGRVVDGTGQPVAGAKVFELTRERPVAQLPSAVAASAAGGAGSTLTAADGTYELTAVPAPTSPALAGVHAQAPGGAEHLMAAVTSVQVTVRAGETARAPDLVLGKASGADPRVRVRVVDAGGAPVWGAALSWSQFGGSAVTDREGRVVFAFDHGIAGIPPVTQRLVARAPGRAPALTPPFLPDADSPPEVEVALGAGLALSGTVVREDGTPVEGAHVLVADARVPAEILFPPDVPALGSVRPPAPGEPQLPLYAWATTDADGAFATTSLPEPPWLVRVTGAGFPPTTATASAAGETLRVTVPGGAACEVPTGSVEVAVQGPEGEPLTRAVVGIHGHAGPRLPAPGVFRFEGLTEGRVQFSVGCAGYVTTTSTAVIVPDGVTRTQVVLARALRITGRVACGDGVSTSDLLVQAHYAHSGPGPAALTHARGDGRFALDGLQPGRYWISVGRSATGEPWYVLPEAVDVDASTGAPSELRLRAIAGGVVSVRAPAGTTLSKPCSVRIEDVSGRALARSVLPQGWDSIWVAAPPGDLVVRVLDGTDAGLVARVRLDVGAAVIADVSAP